jgi:putative redox protein
VSDAPKVKPPSKVEVTWVADEQFAGGRPGGPTIHMDGRGATGPSPVDSLLVALAGCTGIDVVEILAKRRTPVERFSVGVVGQRAQTVPRRLTHIQLEFRIAGKGIERVHAERAIDLAVTKYCSVRDSLDPAIPIEWTLQLEN